MKIKQAVIVEGRDDAAVVSKAVDALIITTHGFGISDKTWQLIDKAHDELGIIVLTDPDHAGDEIRRRITERYPDALQAYISRKRATRDGDIGVENAAPEAVREALLRARAAVCPAAPLSSRDAGSECAAINNCGSISNGTENSSDNSSDNSSGAKLITMEALISMGLIGRSDSSALRAAAGEALGIGYGNGKTFLKKLRAFGITEDELARALAEACRSEAQG